MMGSKLFQAMIPISTLVLSSCFVDDVVVMPVVVIKYDNNNEET